jgi:hypothetical protein
MLTLAFGGAAAAAPPTQKRVQPVPNETRAKRSATFESLGLLARIH